MTQNAGVWVDHKQAIIVFLSPAGEVVKRVESNAKRNEGPHEKSPEDVQDRRYMQHLNAFYRETIDELRDVQAILIMGPGEAKVEFQKQIKQKQMRDRVVNVETAGKMTQRQLVGKVRDYFAANPVA